MPRKKKDRPDPTGIALAAAAVGGQRRLAVLIGCSQQNVSFWARRGWVPTERAVEVEQVSGVPRIDLIDPRIRSVLDTATI